MQFAWDPNKAASNLRDHRVTFEEASSVFGDALAISFDDPDHAEGESRLLTFGLTEQGRLLVVSHTERGGVGPNHQRPPSDPRRAQDLRRGLRPFIDHAKTVQARRPGEGCAGKELRRLLEGHQSRPSKSRRSGRVPDL